MKILVLLENDKASHIVNELVEKCSVCYIQYVGLSVKFFKRIYF